MAFDEFISDGTNSNEEELQVGEIKIIETKLPTVYVCKKCGHIGILAIKLKWKQDNNILQEKVCFNCFQNKIKELVTI